MIALVYLHLGLDHWWQSMLVLLLAFAPFLILVGVVFYVRQREAHEEDSA